MMSDRHGDGSTGIDGEVVCIESGASGSAFCLNAGDVGASAELNGVGVDGVEGAGCGVGADVEGVSATGAGGDVLGSGSESEGGTASSSEDIGFHGCITGGSPGVSEGDGVASARG